MKKVLLAVVVIVPFILYSVHKRSEKELLPVIVPKPNTPSTSASSDSSNNVPTPSLSIAPPKGSVYKDGTYTGDAADAFYGNIQVQATIANGRITNIQFLQYPNDRDRSIEINQQADPILAQEAIQTQSAQVDIVSGATDSSQAFIQSLQSALNKAKS